MDMNFDVNKVFQERLASSMGLDKYQLILEQVKKTDVSVDADFQRTFNGFYMVRRNETWRKVYYQHFERVKRGTPTFASILTHLYECTGNIEPSFSSKTILSQAASYAIFKFLNSLALAFWSKEAFVNKAFIWKLPFYK